MISFSLLIPAHNEAATMKSLVTENNRILRTLLENEKINNYEIVILNDGSTDNTGELLNELCKFIELKILTNKTPTGISAAFELLYSKVGMDWYMLIPGDAQWPPSATSIMLENLILNPNVSGINGVRGNKKDVYGYRRRMVSYCYSKLGDSILGTKGSDPGSIKILPREVLQLVKNTNGMAVEIETMLLAQKIKKSKIMLVKTPWQGRISGVESGARFIHVINTVFYIPKLILLAAGVDVQAKRRKNVDNL
jgi:glycosyltransferase involved in cell wall biosynthesis